MTDNSDDVRTRGAASRPSSSHSSEASLLQQPSQSDTAVDVKPDATSKAEEVNCNAQGSNDLERVTETAEQLQAKYRWYQCDTTPPSEYKYYYHCDTGETSWNEPIEPYFIYDSATQQVDSAGLQYPASKPSREEVLGLNKPDLPETYTGYNPKIHGNYDPNADYAKYHDQKRAEEAAVTGGDASQAVVPGALPYESTMTLNRFTGHAQAADLEIERHSDHAKSGRQMNAFFDVDAAANAHGGKSLREERTNQKVSKKQVKKFQEAKKQKKREKQMAFLLS